MAALGGSAELGMRISLCDIGGLMTAMYIPSSFCPFSAPLLFLCARGTDGTDKGVLGSFLRPVVYIFPCKGKKKRKIRGGKACVVEPLRLVRSLYALYSMR
jgi:hypothetical protein